MYIVRSHPYSTYVMNVYVIGTCNSIWFIINYFRNRSPFYLKLNPIGVLLLYFISFFFSCVILCCFVTAANQSIAIVRYNGICTYCIYNCMCSSSTQHNLINLSLAGNYPQPLDRRSSKNSDRLASDSRRSPLCPTPTYRWESLSTNPWWTRNLRPVR